MTFARAAPAYRVNAVGRRSALSIEALIIALTTAAVLALGTVSGELLNLFKIHYISAGGNFFEKIHPATYLAFLALLLLLLRHGDPIGEIDGIVSDAKLLLVFLFACALLLFQCVALQRPVTSVVDTFLLPAMLAMILWNFDPRERRAPTLALHLVIWTNIAIAFYEYFGKHRLIPITLGKAEVLGDWRSTALLGHPLSAAGIVAMYIMALLLRPKTGAARIWQLPAAAVAMCSLLAFGARTALVSVLVVLAGIVAVSIARLIRGERFALGSIILATSGVIVAAAMVSTLLGTGVFDRMFDRFSADNGSAYARIATLHLLSHLDWNDFLFGVSQVRATALQSMLGLDYGIENFWIACVVQYGGIQTVLITTGVGCLFAEILKRSAPGTWVAVLFLLVIAASSVSFSSKNIVLATHVAIILLLLPRVPFIRPIPVPR